jgi:hypothetical protein
MHAATVTGPLAAVLRGGNKTGEAGEPIWAVESGQGADHYQELSPQARPMSKRARQIAPRDDRKTETTRNRGMT